MIFILFMQCHLGTTSLIISDERASITRKTISVGGGCVNVECPLVFGVPGSFEKVASTDAQHFTNTCIRFKVHW